MHAPFRVLAACVLLAWAAMAAAATAPAPVPTINTAALDVPVREAIDAAQRELQTLRQGGASELSLGNAHGELAMVYHAHDLLEPALAAYREAARLTPNRADWHYLLGVTAHATGAADEALSHFNRSLQLEPGYAPTLIRRGRIHAGQAHLAAAEQDLRAALQLQPDDAVAHAELGQVLLQQGQHAGAAEQLQRALSLQPAADQLHYSLGLAYRALGDVDKARSHLARRGEREPRMRDPLMASVNWRSQSAQHYYEVALDQLHAGQHGNAESAFARAAQLDPAQPLYARMHALQLLRQGKLDAARDEGRRAVALEPAAVEGHLLLGQIGEVAEDDHDAAAAFREALRLDPASMDARHRLAAALTRLRQFEAAVREYDTIARSGEGNARAYALYRRGLLELVQGRCQAARASLQQALEASGGSDASAMMALARTAAGCEAGSPGALAQARAWAQQVYDARPDAQSAETLAMVLAASGQQQDAIDLQTQAIFESLKGPHGAAVLQLRPELQANLQRYREGKAAAAVLTSADPLLVPDRATVEQLRAAPAAAAEPRGD